MSIHNPKSKIQNRVVFALLCCVLTAGVSYAADLHRGGQVHFLHSHFSYLYSDGVGQARQAIEAAYLAQDAAYSRKDADGYLALFAPDFVSATVGQNQGKEQIRQTVLQRFNTARTVRMVSRIANFTLKGDQAVVVVDRTIARQELNAGQGEPTQSRIHDVSQETWAKGDGSDWLLKRREQTPLQRELSKMVAEDQAIRKQTIADPKNAQLLAKMKQIDTRDTARMKQILAQYGWPGASLVGDTGASAAWLLVQHADRDRPFQRQALKLMQVAVSKGDASKIDFAYLTDRVLVGEGKKQIYGTQFKTTAKGELVPNPIEDPTHVDARRKSIGLPSMAEYKQMIERMYHPQQQQGNQQ